MDLLEVLKTARYGSCKLLDAVEMLLDQGREKEVGSILGSRFDLDHDLISGRRLQRILEPLPGGQFSLLAFGFDRLTTGSLFKGPYLFTAREEDLMENSHLQREAG